MFLCVPRKGLIIPLMLVMVWLCLAEAFAKSGDQADISRIVVTASQIEQAPEDIPQSVEVITAKEIRRQQSKTAAEALHHVAGLDVSSLGAPGEDLDLRIRGSDRDEVLVLIDGMPINNIIESRNLLLSSVPVDFIERIEIVRGAESVLYGGSAGGGVVNIITKDGSGSTGGAVSAAAGNLATFIENARVGFETKQHDLGMSFTRHDQGGRFENDRFWGNSYFLNYTFRPTDTLRIKAHAMLLNQRQELAFGNAISFASFPTVNYYITRDFDRYIRRDIAVPQISFGWTPSDFYDAVLTYGLYYEGQTLKNSNQNEPLPEPAAMIDSQAFDSDGYRHHADLKNTFSLVNHENFRSHLIVGGSLDWEFLSYTDAPFPGDVTAKTTTTFPDEALGQKGDRRNLAGYLLSHSVLGERVLVAMGVRYDDNSTYGWAASPRFSLGYYHPRTKTKIYGGVAQGFFAPTINQYYLAIIGGTLTQRLDKEISHTYEVGVEQKLWQNKIRLGAAFFYTDYDTFINEGQLVANARVKGIETDLRIKPFSWGRISLKYTLVNSENRADGSDLASRPDHTIDGEIGVEPLKGLEFWLNGRYVSSRLTPTILSTQALGDLTTALFDQFGNPADERLPGYFVLNASARYAMPLKKRYLKEVSFFARGNNLLNATYQERFGYPMPGISFLAGAEAGF